MHIICGIYAYCILTILITYLVIIIITTIIIIIISSSIIVTTDGIGTPDPNPRTYVSN